MDGANQRHCQRLARPLRRPGMLEPPPPSRLDRIHLHPALRSPQSTLDPSASLLTQQDVTLFDLKTSLPGLHQSKTLTEDLSLQRQAAMVGEGQLRRPSW